MRKKSLKAIKDKLRSKTGRTRGVSLKQIIDELNPILKGWFGYFKHAHWLEFKRLDGFIRRRLRALGRTGAGQGVGPAATHQSGLAHRGHDELVVLGVAAQECRGEPADGDWMPSRSLR